MEALAQVIVFDEGTKDELGSAGGRPRLPLKLWGADVIPIESVRRAEARGEGGHGQAEILPFEAHPLKLVEGGKVARAAGPVAGEGRGAREEGMPPTPSPRAPEGPGRSKRPGYRAIACLKRLASEERGQGTTEYAILVGVLVVIAIMAILIFRDKVQELWNAIADGINSL